MLVRDDSAKGDIDIGRYYAARDKLVGVDEEHEGSAALACVSYRGVSGYRSSINGSGSRHGDDRCVLKNCPDRGL